jgi:flagellar motor switch protein FliN
MSKGTQASTGISADVLAHVEVELEAHVGKALMSIGELTQLAEGSIIKLDSALGRDVEIRLNGAVVAMGQLVAVDDNFAVRITHIAAP